MNIVEFESWVYRNYSIDLSAYKPNQLHRRISSLMSRLGLKDYLEYTKLLEKNDSQKQRFLDFITINVTEFFRNPELYLELESILKDELLVKKAGLRAWSAACSIGAEPYSMAIILDKISPGANHMIMATDIDETILKRGKAGVYFNHEVKSLKEEYINKYFKLEGDKYVIAPKLKAMVNFTKHDLIHDKYPQSLDLIVCRNVVIYFNTQTKDDIYKRFYDSLKPGGILFVGATESVYNYRELGFSKASSFIYRKI